MKKAKQAKKTARKVVRKKRLTKAQKVALEARKAAQAEAKLRASLRQVDPYYIDPALIPVGWAYQWKVHGAKVPPGWTCVPFSRHAHDFPDEYHAMFGQIALAGLVLMEARADQVVHERYEPQKAAKAMHDEHPASGRSEFGRIQIMPQDWVETEKIPREAMQNEGPPVDVAVVLTVRVPMRWKSAALFLKLPLSEYVRRRILMERPILGSMMRWDGQPDQQAVYETVNLQFTPVNPSTPKYDQSED